MYAKERVARLALQQEASRLQSIVEQLQSANQDLEREYKTIPALHESNEILRNDLGQLRQRLVPALTIPIFYGLNPVFSRYKEDKLQMGRKIKSLETKLIEAERTKHDMRQIATRLINVVSTDGFDGAAVSTGVQIRRPHKLVSMAHPKARGMQDFDDGQGGGVEESRFDVRSSIESRVTYGSHSSLYDQDEFDDDEA